MTKIIIILLCSVQLLFAQKYNYNKFDTLATDCYQKGDYEGGLKLMETARNQALAEFGQRDSTYALYTANMAFFYGRLEQYSLSLQLNLEALNIRKQVLGKQHPEYSKSLNNLANIYNHLEQYEKAEAIYKEALAIKEQTLGKKHTSYLVTQVNLADIYEQMERFEDAEYIYKEIIQSVDKKDDMYPRTLTSWASLYETIGRYEAAEPLLLEALKNIKEKHGTQYPQYAATLNDLAALYERMGLYEQAEPLLLEAMAILEATSGKQNSNYASAVNNLAFLYKNMNQNAKAEEYYLQSLAITAQLLGKESSDYALIITNLAYLYKRSQRYDQALLYYTEALAIRKKIWGTEHSEYAAAANNLASFYESTKQPEKAIPLLEEASNIWLKNFGNRHPNYISVLNNLIRVKYNLGDSNAAWAYARQAIQAACGEDLGIEINAAWAKRLSEMHYDSYKQREALIACLEAIYEMASKKEQKLVVAELAGALIKQNKDKFAGNKDKLRMLEQSNDWMLRSLKVLDNKQQINQGFELAEANKSNLLMEAFKTNQAYRFGNLPDSLARQEKQLQQKQLQLEASLLENQAQPQKDSLRALLNELNSEIKNYKTKIEQQYPKYASFKYEQKQAGIADIQALLSEKTALLEYVVGDSTLYVFYMDKQSATMVETPITKDSLARQVRRMHRLLSSYNQLEQSHADYTQIAHWFYKIMLEKTLENTANIEHLIVIPDGELSYLPFETFLREPAANDNNYSNLHYLIRDFKISYNYSATLWKENLQNQERSHNGQILGIAANYNKAATENQLPVYRNLRHALSPLPSARQEVEMLSQHFAGYFAFDSLANERAFKQKASEYGIIHLAMHGILDKKNPILSSLAFTEDGDSAENNFLQAYEISQMRLNADLVVLSACETGYGKFEKGNGTASLARAFMYAGVPALVVSLWEVNDASTSQIMQLFYKNMAAGMDKAEALRQAKMQYISGAKGTAAHPAYWSAFVQIGDSRSIKIGSNKGNWLWRAAAGLGICVAMAAVLQWRRNRKTMKAR